MGPAETGPNQPDFTPKAPKHQRGNFRTRLTGGEARVIALLIRNDAVQRIRIVRKLVTAEVSFWKIASAMQFTIKYSA
jgi:hypothetical protein